MLERLGKNRYRLGKTFTRKVKENLTQTTAKIIGKTQWKAQFGCNPDTMSDDDLDKFPVNHLLPLAQIIANDPTQVYFVIRTSLEQLGREIKFREEQSSKYSPPDEEFEQDYHERFFGHTYIIDELIKVRDCLREGIERHRPADVVVVKHKRLQKFQIGGLYNVLPLGGHSSPNFPESPKTPKTPKSGSPNRSSPNIEGTINLPTKVVTGAPENTEVAIDSATIAASHVVGAGSSEGQALTKVINTGGDAVGTLIPGQILTESNNLEPVASSSKAKLSRVSIVLATSESLCGRSKRFYQRHVGCVMMEVKSEHLSLIVRAQL